MGTGRFSDASPKNIESPPELTYAAGVGRCVFNLDGCNQLSGTGNVNETSCLGLKTKARAPRPHVFSTCLTKSLNCSTPRVLVLVVQKARHSEP